MAAKPKTIDEYLAPLNADQRRALEKLRKTIKATAPKAEECISYGLAAFRQNGMLVGFGATPNHCSFYLMTANTLKAFENELKGYDISKGTIRFDAKKPLPVSLVRKLVKARLAENEAGLKRKAVSTKTKKTVASAAKAKPSKKTTDRSNEVDVDAVVDKLKRLASSKVRDGMARYAIPSDNAFGVPVGVMRSLAKQLGRNHELAIALWDTGWYEARMLATFVDEPERVPGADGRLVSRFRQLGHLRYRLLSSF